MEFVVLVTLIALAAVAAFVPRDARRKRLAGGTTRRTLRAATCRRRLTPHGA